MVNDHGITGNWRGHYTYSARPDDGGNFDAIFTEKDGNLKGEIRDEGILGHAVVSGTFVFPDVNFTKTYFTRGLEPIQYVGTMSGDGKTMTGRWTIQPHTGAPPLKGTWMAHRTDNEEKKKEKQAEQQRQNLENVR
jgi:hypothetical protein